ADFRDGSFASVWRRIDDFRSTPKNRHRHCPSACLKGANNGSGAAYSITLSARASKIGERLRPRAFADFALMASSKRVGCVMGRSAGLAPFKILSTKAAERRVISTMFGP